VFKKELEEGEKTWEGGEEERRLRKAQ